MESSPSAAFGPGMDDPSGMGFDSVERGMDAPGMAMADPRSGATTESGEIRIGHPDSGETQRAGEHHPFGTDRPISLAQAENFVGESIWIERADGSDIRGRLLAVHDDHIVLEREMRSGFVSFEFSKSDIKSLRVQEQ